jgi:SpoVK/Ycf46/Vps4 family AAA+-type ATPase
MLFLLAGPPGAGKAAAAKLMASEAGLPLYRLDLASVVSKYVGETEKSLEELFDRAENTEGVLLLDEADTLFGKRTEVADAGNRYANRDAATLLKRIETYPGIVILTTHSISKIDPAIRRRARFALELSLPAIDHRKERNDPR